MNRKFILCSPWLLRSPVRGVEAFYEIVEGLYGFLGLEKGCF